ncbi:hypothetical protein Leryth_015672 [Lithospermum erythrorhizon]|nr:hypothetical protein Leryth_015672 [Lithospermum erythrorhizon]
MVLVIYTFMFTNDLVIQYKPFPEMNEKYEEEEADNSNKQPRSKASARRRTRAMKAKRHLKQRREEFFGRFDESANIFQATFGNRSYTWAFRFFWEDLLSEFNNSFRLAALKWHPDRHQGPTQGLLDRHNLLNEQEHAKESHKLSGLLRVQHKPSAAEKFKRCVDAYKSLCDALSTA